MVEDETCRQYGVEVIGRSAEMVDDFYAISAERRITHPAVAAITHRARGGLFAS